MAFNAEVSRGGGCFDHRDSAARSVGFCRRKSAKQVSAPLLVKREGLAGVRNGTAGNFGQFCMKGNEKIDARLDFFFPCQLFYCLFLLNVFF